jgi:aspartate/methionine/tyrosine aminotransferase
MGPRQTGEVAVSSRQSAFSWPLHFCSNATQNTASLPHLRVFSASFTSYEAIVVTIPLFFSRLLVQSGVGRFLPSLHRRSAGAGAFLRHWSDRMLSAPGSELGQALGLEAPPPDVIDLALGAPRFDLVPSATTWLPPERRGTPSAWGLPELRQAVADRLGCDSGLAIDPDREVLITLGVAGAFNLVLDAFVNAGDRVVLFDPTSPLYRWSLQQRRIHARWLPTWMEDGRTRFDPEMLTTLMRGSRLIVLTSPANPTGGVLSAEDLERIAWWAGRRDVLIFNDTSFERYCYDGPAPRMLGQPRTANRLLTAGSVSKGHALAAARTGWLVGHRHLIRPCAVTAALQAALVPTLSQQVALAALRQEDVSFAVIRDEFDGRRRYACERLQSLGLTPVWPTGAFFIWLPVAELGLNGRAFATHLVRHQRVLVWPGDLFGPSGKDYVRLSYAIEEGRFREGLARLAEGVRDLRDKAGRASKRAA